ncbi:MAG: biopolymer transporter ExbD [Steroidobacteraceae bacterium]|jgi:biopolymer transport protein ExbD|nr:biopolymer transporter ExbD [Steroidobacteraceae bacterium]
MKKSNRARRMERRHARSRRGAGLNLVSLMDIFTILVFFLLVNSAEVQSLETPKDIQLPESVAENKPRETVVVYVSRDQVLVQGRPIVTLAEAASQEGNIIEPLKAALQEQTDRMLRASAAADAINREVTILGDRELPYRVLKKIMATCTEADYGKLSLAVIQKQDEAVQQVAAAAR